MQAVVADYRRSVHTAQLTNELVCESERPNNRQISIMTRRAKDGGSQGEKTNKI
jgi:hypothetical protein